MTQPRRISWLAIIVAIVCLPAVPAALNAQTVVDDGHEVVITSFPDGASVLIDGLDTGKVTPVELREIAPGTHMITVSAAGWQTNTQKITVLDVDPVSGRLRDTYLSFTLLPTLTTGPAGPQGDPGPQGIQGLIGPPGTNGTNGINGTNGAAATIAVGTVMSGSPGSTPIILNSGTPSAAVFNFVIPQGATGATGAAGAQGATGPQGPQGPPGSGSNNLPGDNTAGGFNALLNIIGTENTAYGAAALQNNSGSFNTASGAFALQNNSGNFNTASGRFALFNNTSGIENTASGSGALITNSTGSDNTAIGTNADVISGNLNNATAIGAGAVVDASNKIRLGNSSVTVIEAQVGLTMVSDRHQKENFQPVDDEEVLKKIRGLSLSSWNLIGQDAKRFRHYGPMAQDFFAAFGQDGIGTIGTPTTITSTDLDGIVMAAVKGLEKRSVEQSKQLDFLRAENADLKEQLNALERKLAVVAAPGQSALEGGGDLSLISLFK
jgi:hypothetical protein